MTDQNNKGAADAAPDFLLGIQPGIEPAEASHAAGIVQAGLQNKLGVSRFFDRVTGEPVAVLMYLTSFDGEPEEDKFTAGKGTPVALLLTREWRAKHFEPRFRFSMDKEEPDA